MFIKRIFILIIVVGIYANIMVNHPSPTLKALGYQQILDRYGEICADKLEIGILYQPGLRVLTGTRSNRITAVVPGGETDYPRIIDGYLQQGSQAIVECSALDAWHTTAEGQKYLEKMQSSAYRVVVFDGGHHLPTLGLAPDIIIIPVTRGFAAHSSMLDAIPAHEVAKLAREAGCRAIIATVPRWGLVKTESSLIRITRRIIADSPGSGARPAFEPKAAHGVTCSDGICFAFVDRDYLADQEALARQIDKFSVVGLHKICLAFDYRYTDPSFADDYCRSLSRSCRMPVLRVNEPVKVANALLSWGVEKDELSQPFHNSENH